MSKWERFKNSNFAWVIFFLASVVTLVSIIWNINQDKFGDTKINQVQANYWYNKGLELSNKKKFRQALEAFDKAIKRKPDFYQSWYEKGNMLVLLERYKDSLEAFDMAIAIKSDFAALWMSKAHCLFSYLGRPEESVEALNKATDIEPDNAHAWFRKGSYLFYLGRYREALEAFNKAIEIKPGVERIWWVFTQKGYTLRKLGRNDEALEAFKNATDSNPSYAIAWYAQACLYSLQKDKSNAFRCLRKSLKTYLNEEDLKNNPDFDFIRNEKEFQSIIKNL